MENFQLDLLDIFNIKFKELFVEMICGERQAERKKKQMKCHANKYQVGEESELWPL